MPWVRTKVRVKHGGVYHATGSLLNLDDFTVEALVGNRNAVRVDAPVVAPPPAEPVQAPETTEPAPLPPAGDAPSDAPLAPPPASDGASPPRLQEIVQAIDLLDADDFVKSGTRKGLPKLDPLSDVLGYTPSADEIEAAMKAREEA